MQIISPISHYRYLQRLFGHRYTSNVPHISCWKMSKSKIPKPSQIQVQAQEMVKFASTTMCLKIKFFNGVLTSIVHLNRMKCFVSEKKQHDRHNGDTHRPIILQDCNTLHLKSYSLKGGIFLSLFTKAKSSNIIWDLWSEPQKELSITFKVKEHIIYYYIVDWVAWVYFCFICWPWCQQDMIICVTICCIYPVFRHNIKMFRVLVKLSSRDTIQCGALFSKRGKVPVVPSCFKV